MTSGNVPWTDIGDKAIGLVHDATNKIYYVVLNTKVNAMDQTVLDEFHRILDEVEATKGEGVLVTVNTNGRVFSSGFNTRYWMKDYPKNSIVTIGHLRRLLARLLTFPMPTLSVVNGHMIAGGVMLALGHDMTVMNGDKKKNFRVHLNEVDIGFFIPHQLAMYIAALTDGSTSRRLNLGHKFSAHDSHRAGFVHDLFENDEQMLKQIHAFAKSQGFKAKNRDLMTTFKRSLH